MPKKTKTPEEISEENKRTNEVGLFNFGDAYLLCAKRLMESPPAHLRFDAPIYFLLLQALELYLKSYLRQKGEDVEALKDLGHDLQRICDKAVALGMHLSPKICDIFAFLDETDALIESRYLRTGFKRRIPIETLLPVVEEIRDKVGESHKDAGVL
jgi:HEPN domain-containing protein